MTRPWALGFGAAVSKRSPATSTTSASSSRAIWMMLRSTASCSSSRSRPFRTLPTCQSLVCRIFIAVILAARADTGLATMRVVTELMEPEHAHCWVRDSESVPATGSGPLDGQTMAVKDMFAVQDRVSSFGLGRWRETHGPSEATAPVIAALLASGASIAGLAKMDQIAWSIVGNVAEGTAPLNSVYPDRFTCGSSSGPASAVAAGLADFGIGSDTGGSIRAPAAACGLFGLRPTHGAIDIA